jgi:hypothetical protein
VVGLIFIRPLRDRRNDDHESGGHTRWTPPRPPATACLIRGKLRMRLCITTKEKLKRRQLACISIQR